MTNKALSPERLRRRCDPAQFSFESTAELSDAPQMLGQTRATDAIRFGVGIKQPGYNLFVAGPPGVGRRTLVEHLLAQTPASNTPRRDWCYVNNFADPRHPKALGLPPGRASRLRDDMDHWVAELRDAIPAAFATDEYRDKLGRIEADFNERQQTGFDSIGERAAADGIALLRTPTGFSFAPLSGREIMTTEEFNKLEEAEQKRLTEKMREYEVELEAMVRQLMQWRRERAEATRTLNEEVVEFAVGRITAELHDRYKDLPEVASYLDAARADVIAHVDDFRKPAEGTAEVDGMVVRTEVDLHRYKVNVVLASEPDAPPPIVYDDHPTYTNLVGRVEHVSQFGALITNFTLIRAGSLHRANGGYLMVDAVKLLTQPYAWEGLKRALSNHEVRIDSLAQIFSMVSTLSLEPEPIPLDVKVVLFGPEHLQPLLEAYDPDFSGLFKVVAEFADELDWTPDSAQAAAKLIAAIAGRHKLRPLSREGVAAVIEESSRLAGDAVKMSLHMRSIEELLQESDYWAAQAGRDLIDAADVAQAVHAQIERLALTRDRVQEAVLRDMIMIDTDGEQIGQINGLMVISLGRATFALPGRITATTRFGKGELIDIHREIHLSGAIHSKGVLTLSSFLATRFGMHRELSLSATLSFEQVYSEVDGDSASVGELCALLSSLARVPIRQHIAITGSVNQLGQVQAIGGVNEKIEGFFDICKARGLTGSQGVVIPQVNAQQLMLRADVVEAVAAGQFSVHAVSTVDEALEILTGEPAGERAPSGEFPKDSVNGKVAARLDQFGSHSLPRAMARLMRGRNHDQH
jgi:lon-related putative ATP-dependent protease